MCENRAGLCNAFSRKIKRYAEDSKRRKLMGKKNRFASKRNMAKNESVVEGRKSYFNEENRTTKKLFYYLFVALFSYQFSYQLNFLYLACNLLRNGCTFLSLCMDTSPKCTVPQGGSIYLPISTVFHEAIFLTIKKLVGSK